MSLVTSASVWTNDEVSPKKRISSMRRTVKKLPAPINTNISEEQEEFVSQEQDEQNQGQGQSNSLEDVQAAQEMRNSRVNQLLNQMEYANIDNDGNKLANFKPLSHPIIQKRTDLDPNVQGRVGDTSIPLSDNPLQIPPPPIRQQPGKSDFAANAPDLGNLSNNPYSNYRMIYEPPKIMAPANYYNKMGLGSGNDIHDNKLMEKINYMIHMLEQQHNEKTNNITEEFVLYTFLGVFIIFIVDSFARAGKYTR